MLSERVHLENKRVHRTGTRPAIAYRQARLQCLADMVRKGVGGDIIRLDQRRIEQIAQGHGIAGLKSDTGGRALPEGRVRDNRHLREITALLRCPIEHHHGSGDLGQAADLSFLVGLEFVEHKPGLGVDHDRSLRRPGRIRTREEQREGENRKRNFAEEKRHSRVSPQHVNWPSGLRNRQSQFLPKYGFA